MGRCHKYFWFTENTQLNLSYRGTTIKYVLSDTKVSGKSIFLSICCDIYYAYKIIIVIDNYIIITTIIIVVDEI